MADEKFYREIDVYTAGRETENAEQVDEKICELIEMLDARVDERVREKYNLDIDEIDEETESQLRREIIEYISDCRDDENTMSMGKAIRRYLCNTFAKQNADGTYTFEIDNKNRETIRITVSDYAAADYDVTKDDLDEYTKIWKLICEKFNSDEKGNVEPVYSTSEIKRIFKLRKSCKRETMFRIGFALHMNNEKMSEFLTNTLAEQSYNSRNANEIIYHFCQKNPELNNYTIALKLIAEYERMCNEAEINGTAESSHVPKELYTGYATKNMAEQVKTTQQLFNFLMKNRKQLCGYSVTAHENFMHLYEEALELSQDDMVAMGIRDTKSPEALAKVLFDCIPRVERKTSGGEVFDFCKINDKTCLLYEGIMQSPLLSDRMRKIIDNKAPVEKKDIVLLSFYNYCRNIENNSANLKFNFETFREETNAILNECGMSGLYALNKFDNLVMLAFWAYQPFEFFGDIIYESFGGDDFEE